MLLASSARTAVMGLDHVGLKAKDWHRAKDYYTSALKPLGYEPIVDWGTGGGFGVPGEKTGGVYISEGLPSVSAQTRHCCNGLPVQGCKCACI